MPAMTHCQVCGAADVTVITIASMGCGVDVDIELSFCAAHAAQWWFGLGALTAIIRVDHELGSGGSKLLEWINSGRASPKTGEPPNG